VTGVQTCALPISLDLRCEGFAVGFGGVVDIVPLDLSDPTSARATVAGALQARPGVDGVLTLGPVAAGPTVAALRDTGRLDHIQLATFDLGPETLEAIEAGDITFAIDQAQYLQGYLPVTLLTLYLRTGAVPLGSVDGVIMTGPNIVTAETAGAVIEHAARGVR